MTKNGSVFHVRVNQPAASWCRTAHQKVLFRVNTTLINSLHHSNFLQMDLPPSTSSQAASSQAASSQAASSQAASSQVASQTGVY
jgi:hypothetical protein